MTDFSRRAALTAPLVLGLLGSASSAAFAAAAAAPVATSAPAIDLGPRERLLMDFGWKFHLGHAADLTKDFDYGLDQRTYAKSGARVASAAVLGFDDSGWRDVNLPHDWAVELPFAQNPFYKPSGKPDDEDMAAAHGFKALGRLHPENSIGWYRKVFDLPAGDLGKRLFLEFDGAFRDALVMFNGFVMGREESGYSPFSIDITDFINPGAKNVLTVRVDATLGEGWFYEGAGIYRHVWLVKTDPVHVPQWGTFVRSSTDGSVRIATTVVNESDKPVTAELLTSILDGQGRPVAAFPAASSAIAPWAQTNFAHTTTLNAPILWSTENPHLYTAVTEVTVAGAVVDRYATSFGIRSLRFDAKTGFYLNDRPLKLKGTNNHQDHAGVGAAIPDALQIWRLEQLKSMGANAYRCSHNPPTPELLDACDRLGILVIDEVRTMSSSERALDELERMVRRDRNHPSVILWSICNEEPLQGTERGARVARTMKRLVNQLDPTRQITAAMDNSWGKGITPVIDVMGFNYRHHLVDDFHRDHPTIPIIGSEMGSTVSTRGEYRRDDVKGLLPAYDTEAPWWASTAEAWQPGMAEKPYFAGGFIWTGFDYRGEPTPYNRWPNISSQFGMLDTCGFPKDNYYYYRAWWRSEPLLHLFPHWNWEGEEGKAIPVWVHTNLDRVELFLNGKSLGFRDVKPNRHIEWSVPYAPGVIEAHGYKGGKIVLRQRRETAGPAAALRLTADRTKLAADGEDVAILKVEVVDAKGRTVPRASHLVQFKVTGPGQIIGVGNGDPTSHEPDKAEQRKAFNSLCCAILQTKRGQPGALQITAQADSLKAALLTINSASVKPRAAVI